MTLNKCVADLLDVVTEYIYLRTKLEKTKEDNMNIDYLNWRIRVLMLEIKNRGAEIERELDWYKSEYGHLPRDVDDEDEEEEYE